jgi:hypothetical protein
MSQYSTDLLVKKEIILFEVLVFGAGSIGNHLSYACRQIGWNVTVYDTDPVALTRMQNEIYPSRYERWDSNIQLTNSLPENRNFDLIIVGTPPDTHISIACQAIERFNPKLILIEKPLCPPDMNGLSELYYLLERQDVRCLVGFNHNLADSIKHLESFLVDIEPQKIQKIEINWLENWSGIFAAHPWLDGPKDSYLGFSNRGGGACHEHSHAVALAVHVSNRLGLENIELQEADVKMCVENSLYYDFETKMTLTNSQGVVMKVNQNVTTSPAIKELRILLNNGEILWRANVPQGGDMVSVMGDVRYFSKNRIDDFRPEIEHIDDILMGRITSSPIDISKMRIVSELSQKAFDIGLNK